MIRVAAGEKLPFTQDDIKREGWAIECRINAEDPLRGFLPSVGRLVRYRPPAEIEGRVRVDTGVYEGGEIPHALRLDDRQAGGAWRHPRGRHRADERGAQCLRDPRHREQPRIPVGAGAPSALSRPASSRRPSSPRSFRTAFVPTDVPHDDPQFPRGHRRRRASRLSRPRRGHRGPDSGPRDRASTATTS